MSNQTENAGYIKPGKNFKFPRHLRRFVRSIVDDVARNEYKNMIIQATLHGNRLPEKKTKKGALIEVVDL